MIAPSIMLYTYSPGICYLKDGRILTTQEYNNLVKQYIDNAREIFSRKKKILQVTDKEAYIEMKKDLPYFSELHKENGPAVIRGIVEFKEETPIVKSPIGHDFYINGEAVSSIVYSEILNSKTITDLVIYFVSPYKVEREFAKIRAKEL